MYKVLEIFMVRNHLQILVIFFFIVLKQGIVNVVTTEYSSVSRMSGSSVHVLQPTKELKQ